VTNIDFQAYWANRESSLNRSAEASYYALKACEHAIFLNQADTSQGLVDFGCGAGELLYALYPHLSCQILALDFSSQLLNKAKQLNAQTKIQFLETSAQDFAKPDFGSAWMSCGAVNQYSNQQEMSDFLHKFVQHPTAKELYLFDCIDPVKYALFRSGVIQSYLQVSPRTRLKQALSVIRTLKALFFQLRFQPCEPLDDMGYGFRLDYWLQAIPSESRPQIAFFSSLMFEYRYHVVLKK